MTFDKFTKYGGWAVAIFIAGWYAVGVVNGPTEELAVKVSGIETKQAVLDTEHVQYRADWKEASDQLKQIPSLVNDVGWIKKALDDANFRPKKLDISTPPSP